MVLIKIIKTIPFLVTSQMCQNGGVSRTSGIFTTGLIGNYYNVAKQQGVAPTVIPSDANIQRIDSTISFSWGTASPIQGITQDNFVVVWNGVLRAAQTGRYNLYFTADDGIRVYLAGEIIVDSWLIQNAQTIEVSNLLLDSTINYSFQVEYFEQNGVSQVLAQ